MIGFEQKHGMRPGGQLIGPVQPERGYVRPTADIDPLIVERQAFGNQAMLRRLQAKLRINQPGDKYEQEADRIANQVMRMPEPQVSRQTCGPEGECEETMQAKPLADQITPLVQRQIDEEEEEILQPKQQPGSAPTVTPNIEAGINSLKGGGQPLDRETRAFMEPRFGHDFGDVRVHTDSKPADLARSVNSRAFTVGNNVAFGAGQYQPGTEVGQRLLAHELTHVVQQRETINRVFLPIYRFSSDTIATSPEVRTSLPGGQPRFYQPLMLTNIKENGTLIQRSVIRTGNNPEEGRSSKTVETSPSVTINTLTGKVCGPDITSIIMGHLNDFISQNQGDLSFIWYFGARGLGRIARENGRKIRAAASGAEACPIHEDCGGTYTFGGQCISGYHIDHILIMAYIEASYGASVARSAGQYNESFWLGFFTEGSKFEVTDDEVSKADLTFNELAICLAEHLAHAEEVKGKTDILTLKEVQDCFKDAKMADIGRKESTTGSTAYTDCTVCLVAATAPSDLELPPVDL